MKSHTSLILALTMLPFSTCLAQSIQPQHANAKLSSAEFNTMAAACAPDVPIVTLRSIAHAESAFRPYALSVDYPLRTARRLGFNNGGIFLERQPKSLAEARAWTHWLLRHGRSVSIGIMQISTQRAADLGVTPDQLFDPCTNIRAGAQMLTAKYRQAAAELGEGQEALRQALSLYNSGSPFVGFDNGYVSSVVGGVPNERLPK